MLIDQINLLKDDCASVEIVETFNEFSCDLSLSRCDWSFVNAIINCLPELCPNDSYEFLFTVDGNSSPVITQTRRQDIDELEFFFNDDLGDELSLSLIVRKTTDSGTSSIYSLNDLQKHIERTSLKSLLTSIGSFFNEMHYFEVYESIEEFNAYGFSFYSHNHPESRIEIENLEDREDICSFIRENSSELTAGCRFLPKDFQIAKRSKYNLINDFFDNAHAVLTVSSISNMSDLNDDGTFSFKIDGYKSVHINGCQAQSLGYSSTNLGKLNDWLFERGGRGDKLGLVRNILSLHTNDDGLINIDEEALRSIRSNYSIYLKDNIQQYIEIKNKVTDYIFDYSSRIQNSLDEYLTSFRGNIVVIIGFFVSVVIVNGLKDNGTQMIFSSEYLFIVLIICFISLGWMIFSYKNLRSRALRYQSDLTSVLQRNYHKVIDPDELKSYIEPVIGSSKRDLNKQLRFYRKWWCGLLVVVAISFILGNKCFSVTDHSSNPSEEVMAETESKTQSDK